MLVANVSHGLADQMRQMAEVSHGGTINHYYLILDAVNLKNISNFACSILLLLLTSIGISRSHNMFRPTQPGQRLSTQYIFR